VPDNDVSAFGLIGAEIRARAAEMARERPRNLVVAPDNMVWPGGSFFNQGPKMPDQLFCSYRAGSKQAFRPFSSLRGFRKTGNALKKFKKVASAGIGASLADFAGRHSEGMLAAEPRGSGH
jgi:hypothetical protein